MGFVSLDQLGFCMQTPALIELPPKLVLSSALDLPPRREAIPG